MALSQHSKNLAKQVLTKDNFTNEHLIEAYGVNQDQLLQLIEQKEPQELYDATYTMYLNAYGDTDIAKSYAEYLKNFASAMKEQSTMDDAALQIKKEADEGAAKRRQQEFDNLPLVTKPKEIKNSSIVDEDISSNLLREYGNNLFELVTYDQSVNNGKNNGRISLTGVLKQIPSFSMGTSWAAGPAASLSDIVKGFMCSDLMELIMTIGGNDRSWNAVDEGTDRTYDKCNVPSFNLEFRIYPDQTIGTTPLTTYETWISALSLFVQPSIASKVNINAMGNNVINGALQGLDNFHTMTSNMMSMITGNKKEGTEDQNMLENAANAIGKIVDDTAVLITSRDDKNRVEGVCNKKNFYGGKLWKLKLLPGIIQKPIIVFIKSWSVTYSKEINITNKKPIYVDFSLNCELDQIPDAGVWMYYMDKNSNEQGVFPKYEKTESIPTNNEKIKTVSVKTNDTESVITYEDNGDSRKIIHMGTAKPGEEYTKQGMETHSAPPGYRWNKKIFAEVWYLEKD